MVLCVFKPRPLGSGRDRAWVGRRHTGALGANTPSPSPVPWLLLVVLSAVFLQVRPVTAQIGLNEERQELLREVDCARECRSTSKVAVCGTNGKTYNNICKLQSDACKGTSVKVKHEGECTLTEMCPDDRRAKLDEVSLGHTVWVPRCNPDGTYASIQCHEYSNYCWCSKLDGSVFPDTIAEGKQPDCSEVIAKPPVTAPPKGRCEGKRLKEFKDSFIKHVKKEFERDNKKASKKRSDGKKVLREALRWKFKQLDKNKDGFVRRAEYKGLRRLVRKQLQPRKCAKQFPNFCDIDNNKNLAETEWIDCFMPSVKQKDPSKCCKCQINKPCKCKASNMCGYPPKPEVEVSCEKERAEANENSGNSALYKPTCTPDGQFEPIQCYESTGYCWCVDVKTGQGLEGTTVRYGKPSCDKPMPHAKEWPGCEGEKKGKFMKNFQAFLNKTVSDISMSNAKRENQNIEEFAAKNFFNQLDSNNNGFLEKKEKKLIRKKLQKEKKLKKCARKLSMYCDYYNDRKISLEEWIACSKMPKDTDDPVKQPRRHSENPFETILVPEE